MSESRCVFAEGRNRRLYRNSARGPFYVRFNIAGKDTPRSLGTTDLEAAKIKAKFLIADAYAAARGDADAIGRLRRQKFATLGEIVDRYQPDPRDVAPATATTNRASFLRLAREGAASSGDVRELSAELLVDGRLIEEFKRKRKLAMRDLDLRAQESAARTINSTIKQGRSVVSRSAMEMYVGLRLPNLAIFREVATLKVDSDVSFVPFPAGTIERIEELMPKMPRNVFLTTVLMLYMGLRNKEVQFAKWEWFTRQLDGTWVISIGRRAYFKTKNGSHRTLQIPASVVAKLWPFWGAPNDWVIDLSTPWERYDPTHREINAWLRPLLPGRTKCAYELRKHAASVILSRGAKGALEEAARFLGDSIVTTEKHYAKSLRMVTAVDVEEARARFAVVKLA